MMKIRLLPVFSRLAEEDEVPSALQARLPQSFFVQESKYAQ
jgi:hypothetical protein